MSQTTHRQSTDDCTLITDEYCTFKEESLTSLKLKGGGGGQFPLKMKN